METQEKKELTFNMAELYQAMASGSVSAAQKALEVMDSHTDEAYTEWQNQRAAARRRFRTIHNPYYLIEKGEVPNTVVMRTLAQFIRFCHFIEYHNDPADGWYDDYYPCVLDDDKLRFILRYMFDVELEDVHAFFYQRKLVDLMHYVEEHTRAPYRTNLEEFEKWEQGIREEMLELFRLHNNGRPFSLDCNLHYTKINPREVCLGIYNYYHIIISSSDRKHLHSFEDMLNYILYRLWNGGQFHPHIEDDSEITVFQMPLEEFFNVSKEKEGKK